MSEMTIVRDREDEKNVIRILGNSLYPGAKEESIQLVLAYCRANGMDPFLKPVHIVPTNIKVSSNPDRWEKRDVLMPGIADYRIKAARSGEYGGKGEPEFGPDVTTTLGNVTVTYPAWCRITVKRIVQGQAREFVANERWLENYATAARDTDAPNTMWKKRAYGQLAKCAESQALRMAFPEFSAGYTAEEMEGRDTFDGQTIDADPPRGIKLPSEATQAMMKPAASPPPTNGNGKTRHSIAPPPGAPDEAWRVCLDKVAPAMAKMRSLALVEEMAAGPTCSDIVANGPEWARVEHSRILADNVARFRVTPDAAADELGDVAIAGEEKVGAGD